MIYWQRIKNLPPDFEKVLLWWKAGDFQTGYYDPNVNRFMVRGVHQDIDRFTHWAVPEPPQQQN